MLYSLITTFNARTFGPVTMGTIQGSVYSAAAMVNLLQYPALIGTNSLGNGDLSYLNACFGLLSILLAVLISRHGSMEGRSRLQLMLQGKVVDSQGRIGAAEEEEEGKAAQNIPATVGAVISL